MRIEGIESTNTSLQLGKRNEEKNGKVGNVFRLFDYVFYFKFVHKISLQEENMHEETSLELIV